MVPPPEHCQGERSSPQFQIGNSPWCATRPLAASFSWLVQSNSPAPSPKCPPVCRGFCWVGIENRNLRETIQKMSLWFPCSSAMSWAPEEGTSLESTVTLWIQGFMTLWIQGFTNHTGCKWLRSPSALGAAGTHWNTKEAGGSKTQSTVVEGHLGSWSSQRHQWLCGHLLVLSFPVHKWPFP